MDQEYRPLDLPAGLPRDRGPWDVNSLTDFQRDNRESLLLPRDGAPSGLC